MIRFLFLIILLGSTYLYIKYHEHHPYFKIELISKKYNLVNLSFITLNNEDYIENNDLVLLMEDAIILKEVLEDMYINNIKVEFKKEIRY